MKKSKIFISLLLLVLTIFSFSCFTNNNFSITYAEEEQEEQEENQTSYKSIKTINDLKSISENMSKTYILENDIIIEDDTFSTINGTFKGVLNGNGYSISGLKTPLFDNVGINACISNLQIKDSIILIQETESTSEKNYGFIANTISGASIFQVRLTNNSILSDETDGLIISNTNLGYIAGKAVDGAKIQNNIIENCSLNVSIGQSQASYSNIGGMVGYVGSATLSNNIVNMYSEEETTISIQNGFDKKVNLGGLIGDLDFDKNYIYNNVFVIDGKNISLPSETTNLNCGSIAGELSVEQQSSYLEGFISTYDCNYFGLRTSSNVNYNHLQILDYSKLEVASFTNKENWNDLEEYKWNYDTVWMNITGDKFPSLQLYNTFSVKFNVSPNDQAFVPGNVVYAEFKSQEDEIITENGNNITYGSTVYLTVSVSSENYYQNFFYISALKLDRLGEVYNNETGKKSLDIELVNENKEEVQPLNDEDEEDNNYLTTCTYAIKNFNANCSGEYSVQLGRIPYYLTVKVHDVGTEETGSIIPGKFKIDNQTPIQEKVIELMYGKSYTIDTSLTNTDYSDKALWFIYNNEDDDLLEENLFIPVEENANFYSNKINFTFNENCILFELEDDISDTIYFDLDSYKSKTLEDGSLSSNYELNLVYLKRVKQVIIKIMYDDKTDVLETIANLNIKNSNGKVLYGDDRIVWDEELKQFTVKIAFDKGITTEYIMAINEMNAGLEFKDWYFDKNMMEKLPKLEDDKLAGTFEISEETEEPLTIYCVFKADSKPTGANLVWLWITLAGIGALILIFVIIIIIRRKRGGGGSSYKKYYY